MLLKKKTKHKATVPIILLITALINPSHAQFELKKYSINSGGSTVSNNEFSIKSSAGQANASVQMSNSEFAITGGFWSKTNSNANQNLIFNNGFE